MDYLAIGLCGLCAIIWLAILKAASKPIPKQTYTDQIWPLSPNDTTPSIRVTDPDEIEETKIK